MPVNTLANTHAESQKQTT